MTITNVKTIDSIGKRAGHEDKERKTVRIPRVDMAEAVVPGRAMWKGGGENERWSFGFSKEKL